MEYYRQIYIFLVFQKLCKNMKLSFAYEIVPKENRWIWSVDCILLKFYFALSDHYVHVIINM